MSDLYWQTDEQMDRLRPFFPKSCSRLRVDDRRVLSGVILVNRNGLTSGKAKLQTIMMDAGRPGA